MNRNIESTQSPHEVKKEAAETSEKRIGIMLTAIAKRCVPTVLRGSHVVAKSPAIYPTMSQAFEVLVTSSVKFSTLSTTKKTKRPSYKAIPAPRPKPDLQDWNVHGTTTLSSAFAPTSPPIAGKQQTMMQMQGWNHHDPLSQILGLTDQTVLPKISGVIPDKFFNLRQPSADLVQMAKEVERVEEEALDEIFLSTGRTAGAFEEVLVPSPRNIKHKYPYYPQYASDLVSEAFDRENIMAAESPAAAPSEPTPRPPRGGEAPTDYPQGASDLCDVAYHMDHPGENHQSKTPHPPRGGEAPTDYPQGASDLCDVAYHMDHPGENNHPAKNVAGTQKKAAEGLYPESMYGASDLADEAYHLEHPEMMKKSSH